MFALVMLVLSAYATIFIKNYVDLIHYGFQEWTMQVLQLKQKLKQECANKVLINTKLVVKNS